MPLGTILGGALVSSTLGGINKLFAEQSAQDERKFNAAEAQKNRDFQREERLASEDFNVNMWNMNNEYNSPSALLERAKAAGINPNSLFGQSASVATSSPVTTSPMSGSAASTSSGGALGSAFVNSSQSAVQSAIQFMEKYGNAKLGKQMYDLNEETHDYQVEEFRTRVLGNLANIQAVYAKAGLDSATRDQVLQNTQFIKDMQPLQIYTMKENLNKLRTENIQIVERFVMEKEQHNQSIKESNANIANTKANTAYTNQKTENAKVENSILWNDSYKSMYEAKAAENLPAEAQANAESAGYEAALLKLQQQFSVETGLPLNTPEHLTNFYIWCKGLMNHYIDECLEPVEKTKWKPSERNFGFHDIARMAGQFTPFKSFFR